MQTLSQTNNSVILSYKQQRDMLNDVDFIRNYHLGLLQVLEVVESDQNLDKYCKWLKRVIKKYTVVVVL